MLPNLVYGDLAGVLDKFDTVHVFTRKTMLRDLAGVVAKRMKQSFKNGIEIGMKRGKGQNTCATAGVIEVLSIAATPTFIEQYDGVPFFS
jgi:hypothetical protein